MDNYFLETSYFILFYVNFLVTYSVTGFFCFHNDMKKLENKIQITTREECLKLYKKSINLVTFNILVTVPSFFISFSYFYNMYIGSLISTDFFNVFDILKFFCNIILIDIFFYLFHRLFHCNFLYKRYHKKHHEFIKPVSISALYNHPIDCIFGNVLPVMLPIFILREGFLISNIWITICVIDTIYLSHYGSHGESEFHDLHHEKFNYNFGTKLFMDRLFNTYRKNR